MSDEKVMIAAAAAAGAAIAGLGCFLYKSPAGLTEADVLDHQTRWGTAIEAISAAYLKDPKGKEYQTVGNTAAGNLYAYGEEGVDVLFKPTKANTTAFRETAGKALSYFYGKDNVETDKCEEDGGFAINGGEGWSSCVYDNHNIVIKSDIAIAMGNYTFTCATTNEEALVEYTFGYERCDDGVVRIFLHHSSAPYVSA